MENVHDFLSQTKPNLHPVLILQAFSASPQKLKPYVVFVLTQYSHMAFLVTAVQVLTSSNGWRGRDNFTGAGEEV